MTAAPSTNTGNAAGVDGLNSDKATLLVDPSLLYWAALEGLPRRVNDEALRYAFEPQLPAPLEEIEPRFTWIGEAGCWIACGAESERLSDWIDANESGNDHIESVRPRGLPPALINKITGIGDRTTSIAQRLEFRSRAFESPRRARRRTIAAAAVILTALTTSALLTTGHLRRADAAIARAELIRTEAVSVAANALKLTGVTPPPGLDPRLALAAERRRLLKTRESVGAAYTAEDRGGTLTALLAAWPDEVPTVIDRIQLEQDSLTIQGAVRNPQDFEKVSLRLAGFSPSWSKSSSSASKARQGYSFTIQFSPGALSSSDGGAP
ncbi:MAG: hypothetical protein H6814_09110 [Phycisphaeraceae bacterium]|nr:hypothetical protein [Phycisphaeraceae bacterium]